MCLFMRAGVEIATARPTPMLIKHSAWHRAQRTEMCLFLRVGVCCWYFKIAAAARPTPMLIKHSTYLGTAHGNVSVYACWCLLLVFQNCCSSTFHSHADQAQRLCFLVRIGVSCWYLKMVQLLQHILLQCWSSTAPMGTVHANVFVYACWCLLLVILNAFERLGYSTHHTHTHTTHTYTHHINTYTHHTHIHTPHKHIHTPHTP